MSRGGSEVNATPSESGGSQLTSGHALTLILKIRPFLFIHVAKTSEAFVIRRVATAEGPERLCPLGMCPPATSRRMQKHHRFETSFIFNLFFWPDSAYMGDTIEELAGRMHSGESLYPSPQALSSPQLPSLEAATCFL